MNTVKSTSFWLNVLKMRYEEKNTVNKMKENEPCRETKKQATYNRLR